MNAKVESAENRFDPVKWVLVVGLVLAAVVGNSYFSQEVALLYRVLIVVAVFAVAAGVASTTSKGSDFIQLLRASVAEVRKVVWPTRQEQIQTTVLVVIVVIIAAIILYLLDLGFGYLASSIIG